MNTRIVYMYRSGANDKYYGEVVLSGTPALPLKDFERALMDACDTADPQFIASQVGFPTRFPWETGDGSYDDEIDHCYHELQAVEASEEPSTEDLSPDGLLEQFRQAKTEGWMVFDPMDRVRVRM